MARRAGTLAPVLEECVEFRLRRLTRDAVFQSPNDMKDVETAVLTDSRWKSERQPDWCVVVHDIDAGLHDPKDFVRLTVDIHGLSKDWLSSKGRLPQLVRENCERWRQAPGTIGFFLAEYASLRRLNAKRVEQIGVDRYQPHTQRATPSRHVTFPPCSYPSHA